MSNPLLEIQFRAPFDRIRAEHVEPAVDQLLADAQKALEAAAASDDPLSAVDNMTERLDWALGLVRHLESVATTSELRTVYNAVQPKVSAFYSGIPLHEGLWKALQRFEASEQGKSLTGVKKRFLTKTMDSFRRAGAELDAAGKQKLQEIDIALAEATTKFSQHVLDSTNEFELILEDESRLKGLPPSAIAAARASAEAKGKPGWRFTLQAPSYLAVMTYMDDRATREQLYRAFNIRGTVAPHDNRELLVKILDLRKQKAQMLGFRDFADLVLHARMAHTGATAAAFLEDLRKKTESAFVRENQSLTEFAGLTLEPWEDRKSTRLNSSH